MTPPNTEVVLTGLRTNGEYHLGNYIGALLPVLNLINTKADAYRINLFAPDLHSFTTPIDHSLLYQQTIDNLKLFAAVGVPLDVDNISLYRQSFVPAHSELTWILDNFTGFGEMNRMVEFKDKASRLDSDRVSVGLFNYPVLMAADILLYDAKWVPVGDDQRQHLEFTRQISQRINNLFGQELFVVPEPLAKQQEFVGRSEPPRIRSLQDPTKKMSKSVSDPKGTILLSDSPDIAHKKIMSAETDSLSLIQFDWVNQPGITNLLTIVSALSNTPLEDVVRTWSGSTSYGELKKEAAKQVVRLLTQIQSSLEQIIDADILDHLADREAKMNVIANNKLHSVQVAVGLRRQ